MPSKAQSITIQYYAWNTSNNAGQTGDSGNHTLKLVKDGTEGSPTNSPSQVDSTNCPGLYSLTLTSSEATFNVVTMHGKSSTSNVVIFPVTVTFENLPTASPAASGGLLTAGTSQYQIDTDTSGRIDVGKWLGTAVTAATAGVPDVNVKNFNNQSALTDSNNLPKVDVEDWKGSAASSFPSNFASLGISSAGKISEVTLVDTLTTYTGNTPQSGDAYAIVNSGSYGNSALLTSINNLNNLSALANLFAPSTLVRPSTGSTAYPFTFVVRDSEGNLIDVDSNAVTLTAANAAGTDRSSNLSSVTHAATGQYTFTYTVQSSAVDEGLAITASATVSSAARKAFANCDVADADSLSTLSSIQTQVNKLQFDGSNNVKSTPQTNVTIAGYATGQDPGTYMTNQGYTTTRAGYLDTLNGIVAAIWSYSTRTLSSFGSLVSSIASAILQSPSHPLGTNSDGSVVLPNPPPNGYGGSTALGPMFVNQNTGGTDNLRYVDASGNGVDGATIVIFLATDWPGNPTNALAVSSTGPDGRWTTPVYLPSGTYVAVFSKPGFDGPDVSAPFTL